MQEHTADTQDTEPEMWAWQEEPPQDPSSQVSVQKELPVAAESAVAAVVRSLEPIQWSRAEPESVLAQTGKLVWNLASAQKQSKQRIRPTPQKKENS